MPTRPAMTWAALVLLSVSVLCSAHSQQQPDADFPIESDDIIAEQAGFVIPEYHPSLPDQAHPGYVIADGGGQVAGPHLAPGAGAEAEDPTNAFSAMWAHSAAQDNRMDHHGSHELSPYFFNFENATNITAQLGSTAFLNCRVKRLKDKTVSWVKREGDEIRLLTWGLQTYSNDARYSLNFENPNNWKLQIKYTQRRDAGVYECQVSTHPPRVLVANLRIVAPVVEIIDERGANVGEKFYKTGSTIELRCTISQMPQAQTFILWRHGDHMLNYDTSRGGISVKTDMSSSVIVSTLYIANATPRDSGNYTCSLGDVATGGVLVHILNGEHPAAMQRGSGAQDLNRSLVLLSLASVLLTLTTNGQNMLFTALMVTGGGSSFLLSSAGPTWQVGPVPRYGSASLLSSAFSSSSGTSRSSSAISRSSFATSHLSGATSRLLGAPSRISSATSASSSATSRHLSSTLDQLRSGGTNDQALQAR